MGEYNTETEQDCIRNEKYLDCADPAIDVDFEEIIVHPNYRSGSKNKHHDIALIRLTEAVLFSTYIKPICLPQGKLKSGLTVGYRLTASGWGRTDLCKIIFNGIRQFFNEYRFS